MCGITGIWAFNEVGRFQLTNLEKSTRALAHRGPDDHGTFNDYFVGLGHRRLSIIDTSSKGHQPMATPDGRFQIIFNGEIYNYKELRKSLIDKGIQFQSDSDTEVLLQLYIHEGKTFLNQLHGFFAFAIYDKEEKNLFIARDRLGIKPLLYYQDEFKFLFASEMQSILAFGIDKEVDSEALSYYLQLNYTPAPLTMVKGVRKLLPGQLIEIKDGEVTIETYYEIPKPSITSSLTYTEAKAELMNRMNKSVERRLIADVPVGCFLSGGIDSSVTTAIASQQTKYLSTFSIGFEGSSFFDETKYAELVAKKFNTNHTTFKLSNEEIFSEVNDIVNSFDEPFADSSAIPVYILSKKTKKHITVALSGDGADEIFTGYNKHAAWWKMDNDPVFKSMMRMLNPLANALPKSRSGIISNIMRQITRFVTASNMSYSDRYWFLASFANWHQATQLMCQLPDEEIHQAQWLHGLDHYKDINDLLYTDTQFVLPNDMLKKVDIMSMANALEVRVPFLDHEVVEFVFSLPANYKIDKNFRKKILQDTYRDILPKELYNRPKKGFEMPLLNWLKTSLNHELMLHVFNRDKIEAQGIFKWSEVEKLQNELFSYNPGDSHARVWAIYVFQKWHLKYF